MSEEEIKRDAARYRMLRSDIYMSDGRPSVIIAIEHEGVYQGDRPLFGDELDEVCDRYVQKDNG